MGVGVASLVLHSQSNIFVTFKQFLSKNTPKKRLGPPGVGHLPSIGERPLGLAPTPPPPTSHLFTLWEILDPPMLTQTKHAYLKILNRYTGSTLGNSFYVNNTHNLNSGLKSKCHARLPLPTFSKTEANQW